MPLNFDADLKTVFFDTENGYAVRAIYTPAAGGLPVPVVVLLDEPEASGEVGQTAVKTAARSVQVQRDDVPEPRRGDRLAVGDELFTVGDRALSLDGRIYKLALTKAAAK